jgi:predicted esterase/catechol 2,3-dioxygenase-like lactoylglutathione lyase family enzyme
MNNNTYINGIHHITAIASSASENLAFYEEVLGLRLVKKTVNFDDPYTYHLYYGDSAGTPGTIITFFPWENLPRGKTGAGMVTAIAFAIPLGSVDYWRNRLNLHGVETMEGERFGEHVIHFKDPHGLSLELIETPAVNSIFSQSGNSKSVDSRIAGFHSATALLRSLDETKSLLVNLMGMALYDTEGNRYRFKMKSDDSLEQYYDVVVDAHAENGRQGAGTVHHIAFRTSNDDEQKYWQKSLNDDGFSVTPIRDRKYFKSIYFHEPGGVLFEIATDPPGFTADEPFESLGRDLKLPDQYESMRGEIESRLPKLNSSGFIYEFVKPDAQKDDDQTIVALHGTGGNERDLVQVARQISGSAAILSPRGKILENGMNRFFKRLANGIFDENDVIKRSHELADFLMESAFRYQRPAESIIGLGYSNGANIAAAIMLLRPEVFSRAILFRPMLPLQDPPKPDLNGKDILILRGNYDSTIPAESTERLVNVLTKAGAGVEVRDLEAGHELTTHDLEAASQWLSGVVNFDVVEAVN